MSSAELVLIGTLGGAAIGASTTLGVTYIQDRLARRDRKAEAQAARRARAANVLGRVRILLADLEPTRLGFNVNENSPEQLRAINARWLSLREEVSVFAAGDEDPIVMDAAAKLDVAVSNTINRASWHIHDLRTGGAHAGDMYQLAVEEHAAATARVRLVLDLVRGRDVAELEQTLQELEANETTGL